MARAILFAALSCLLLGAALAQDQANGLDTGGTGPFGTTSAAKALQFGKTSATDVDYCLGRDVTFGGPTTFESWILPAKANGAIFTAVDLNPGTLTPYNEETVSFRLQNWVIQLYVGGWPINSDRTNPNDITSVVVSAPSMLPANQWTRVFGTINPGNASTDICVWALTPPATAPQGYCVSANIAWVTQTRSHLYVGDGAILNLPIDTNFRGLMENLRVWRTVLSADDITALDATPSGDPGVVSSWSFDECDPVGSAVSTVTDTSGAEGTRYTLACGDGDANKQPLCARTIAPYTQVGPFATNPPVVGNLGSGNTVKPTPVPTTKPPSTPPKCPVPPAASFWGDPHFTINGKTYHFYGAGWFWGARTENWAKEQFGFQLLYKRCNGEKTCGAGISWVNKRELGWFVFGESVGLKQDTAITFKGPVMTTPAGTLIEQRGSSIKLVVPGYFTVSGSGSTWEFKFDSKFEGLLADGRCIPANDMGFGTREVAAADQYYKGNAPKVCPPTECPVPPALQPPVCPESSTKGAACDGPDGVPCTWSARCSCIAKICWDTNYVSAEHRRSCLVDASGTGAFIPATVIPAIDATWEDCIVALNFFLASNPAASEADLAKYRCHKAMACPNWCSGPCQGTCNTANGKCECQTGFGGSDCSQAVVPGKKRQFDSTTNEIAALFTGYFDVNSFYQYDTATKSALAAMPVASAKTATFFHYSQVPPPYQIAGSVLAPGASPVNSFGVVINSATSAYSGKFAMSLKLVDQASGSAVVGAVVSVKDDPSDTYTWNSATGTGSFSWNFEAAASAGLVITGLPQEPVCAQVSITSATGVERYMAAYNDADSSDVSIPILTNMPVTVGSSFEFCNKAPADDCNMLADCAACNARPECGWCASTGVCHRGDEAGPYYTSCTVWRSENDPTVSRLVESRRDNTQAVRTTQIRTYLAPDNAQLTVPVEVHIPGSVGSVSFQVRGLFEFTDQMAPFAKFLGSSGLGLINGVQRTSPGSLFAVSSFRDKAHVRPHGRNGDWVYKEHVAFQKTDASTTAFATEWANWATSPQLVADWQFDLGLATLEALFHEAHQGWPLHPAANTKNVVLIFTKSPVAMPGIAVSAADSATVALGKPLPANNLDDNADDYEDYPTLKNVARVLLDRGLIPVFVVPDADGTEAVVSSYRSIVAKFGFGKVWPDATGRNAIKSTMSAAEAAGVVSSILSDLVTSVQIVATNPDVTSTLASPVLFNGDNYPLGAVVKVPITLQRETAANKKRDLDTELFRLFYRDRQMVSVVGFGQFEVVSTTTDAPSAEDKEFTINVGEASSAAHIITLPSWSVYEQNMKGYIVSQPTGATLYNIAVGVTPEQKGTALDASGLIADPLHRLFIDIPATAQGSAANGYLYASFSYKMVDSCGLESTVGTVNIRVVPAGMHAPVRYEPTNDFLASVNENTKWAPTSTLVCVGGLDYDPESSISTKITQTPAEGTLYHIVDQKGTAGAVVKVGDIVTSAFNARPFPAVACFQYVPPVRTVGMENPYGPGFGSFKWQLIDNTGLVSATETTEIDVLPVNYPPVTADSSITGWENTDLNINLVASDDPRPDGINNNLAVSVKIGTLPTRGVLRTKDGVTLSVTAPAVVLSLTNGVPVSVTYTPDANKHSDADATGALQTFDYFTYTATDAGGLSSTGSVRIVITPANAQPVISFTNTEWAFPVANLANAPVTHLCLAISNLKDASNTAVYITTLPKKGSILVNGVSTGSTPVALTHESTNMDFTGTFCFDYKAKKAGTDSLVVKVCTGCGAPTDASFNNYLGGAAPQTITLQVGSQKSAASKGLSRGGVIAVAIVGSLLGIALLAFLAFLVFRPSSSSSGLSSGALKAPLL